MAVLLKDKARVTAKKAKSSSKNGKKVQLIAQEIKLAKILAGNNKKLRDRTLKKLKRWFAARESSSMPFTENDFMRIWKGLFYYMWMSDKPLVQEECAENVSRLVHFENVDSSLLFFKCFLKTMSNEWFGIDFLRLDKFLMLVRRMLRQCLFALKNTEWNSKKISIFCDDLSEVGLAPSTCLGLKMHLTDIYLEELAKVSQGNIDSQDIVQLVKPFAEPLAFSDDKRHVRNIAKNIFRHLIHQSDAGLDYREKFYAWRQAGYPEGNINSMDRLELENGNDNKNEDSDDEEMLADIVEDDVLDPRAGGLDIHLPQLQFDPIEMEKLLRSYCPKPDVRTPNRKFLRALATEMHELASGNFPLGVKRMPTIYRNSTMNVRDGLKRLQQFESKLAGDSKKAIAKKKRKLKVKEFLAEQLMELEKKQKSERKTQAVKIDTDEIENKQKSEQNLQTTGEGANETEKKQKLKKAKRTASKQILKVHQLSGPSSVKKKRKSLPDDLLKSVVVKKKPTEKNIKRQFGSWQVDDIIEKQPFFSTPQKPIIVRNPFSSGKKAVQIALNLNKSQEMKDHIQQVRNSPRIPFDATRKPTKSLLKPHSLPSPVNPFYKKQLLKKKIVTNE